MLLVNDGNCTQFFRQPNGFSVEEEDNCYTYVELIRQVRLS